MRNKGLIMSIEDNKKAVVLTSSGEFCKIPIPKKVQYNIGDEVNFNSNKFLAGLSMSKWGMIAAAVFVIMVMPLIWKNSFVGPVQEVAYVNIDINPSIELALDHNNLVINAKGLNHDGNKVLSTLELKNISAQAAINKITNKAKDYKYLAANKDNLVVISVTSKDKAKYKLLSSNLEKEVEKDLIDNNINGKVETISVSPELKAKADQLNISTGKYAVLLAAMDSGMKISLEEMRSKSIAKAIKGNGGNFESIIKKAQHDDNLDILAIKYSKKFNKKVNTANSNDNIQEQDEDSNNEKNITKRALDGKHIISGTDEKNSSNNDNKGKDYSNDKGKQSNEKKNIVNNKEIDKKEDKNENKNNKINDKKNNKKNEEKNEEKNKNNGDNNGGKKTPNLPEETDIPNINEDNINEAN